MVMRTALWLLSSRNEYLYVESRKAAIREGSFCTITSNMGYVWIFRETIMWVFNGVSFFTAYANKTTGDSNAG